MPVTIQLLQLAGNEDLPLPAYQTEGSSAVDLAAAVTASVPIEPGKISLIPCGFAIALPLGYEAQIRTRSGLALNRGLVVANSPGTIDSDYRGEIKVILCNLGSETVVIDRGMRVAQLAISRIERLEWQSVSELPSTERASGGFGHTGHS